LQKHKQDVSEAYIFSNTPNQTDYEFLKKNVNFQFFINGILFQGSILLFYTSMEAPAKKIELHIKNKTTAEMDLHGTDFKTKVTITYDDFLLKQVVSTETESEREYDFKTAVFERHYYGLGLAPYAFERYLDFYYAVGDNTESLYLLLSPYD
jgi:hypothetical protein